MTPVYGPGPQSAHRPSRPSSNNRYPRTGNIISDLAQRLRGGSTVVLIVGLVVLAAGSEALRALLADTSLLKTATTVFAAVFVQAFPFLALGVLFSGLVAAFVSPVWLADKLSRNRHCHPVGRHRGRRVAWLRMRFGPGGATTLR
jgi:hypothetical protein